MHAALCFQQSISEFAVCLDGCLLDACAIAILQVNFTELPALLLAVHAVHAQQHFGPVLAFGAPGAAINLDDRGQLILRLIECAFEFQLVYLCRSFFKCRLCFFLACLAFFPEVEEHGKVFHRAFHFFVEVCPVFIDLYFFQDACSTCIIIPKAR